MNLDFIFKSPDHIRYENSKLISGLNGGANRIIKVEPEDTYKDNFIVTIYNADGIHPFWKNNIQMSPKQMKIIEKTKDKILLRGWGNDNLGHSFADYGLIINIKDGKVWNCILRLFNKNVYIKYLNEFELNEPIVENLNSEMTSNNKNGIIVEDNIDGEKFEWTFVNNKKQGVWKMFYSNGRLKEVGNMINELPEGNWQAYYNNGTLRAEGQYSIGRQVGRWKYNDETGTLRAEGNYKNGKQDGKWIYYDEDGEIEETEMF